MRKLITLSALILSFTLLFTSQSFAKSALIFTDVATSHWAYHDILWAQNNHLIQGYPDGTFQPDRKVSEAEALKMLISGFDDEELPANKTNDAWHQKYYDFASEHSWTLQGLSHSSQKDKPMSRGDMAVLLSNAAGHNFKTMNEAIQYLLAVGLSNGKTSATIEGYAAQDELTRAQAVTFLRNYHVIIGELFVKPTPSHNEKEEEVPVVDPNGTNESQVDIDSKQAQAVLELVEELSVKTGYPFKAATYNKNPELIELYVLFDPSLPAASLRSQYVVEVWIPAKTDHTTLLTISGVNGNTEQAAAIIHDLLNQLNISAGQFVDTVTNAEDGRQGTLSDETYKVSWQKKFNNISVIIEKATR